jgi:quercetin dioxygenase-like cupin family protein
MVKTRNVFIFMASFGAASALFAATQGDPPTAVMKSVAFEWNDLKVKATAKGETRKVFQTPTATLDELECHVTTLNPGVTSHPPHQHPDEEILIVKEGVVEALVSGKWKELGPGSIIFQAAN